MAIGYIPKKDDSGRQLSKMVITDASWAYLAAPCEIKTATETSPVFMKAQSLTDRYTISTKHFQSDGTDITGTGQVNLTANCTKTQVTFYPDHDFDIVSGKLFHAAAPLSDCRLWLSIGLINPTGDVPLTTTEFVGGLNLKHLDSGTYINTDGRSGKKVSMTTEGAPFNTNTIQMVINHSVGLAHEFTVLFEYYRP